MAPTEIITQRLGQATWKSWSQAILLITILFSFLPLTRVVTENRETPIEITKIDLRPKTVTSPAIPPSKVPSPPSTLPRPRTLSPLPIPSPLSIPTSLPQLPTALSTSPPAAETDFDFPMDEAIPDVPPTPLRLDQAPELIYQPEVVYPYALQRKRIAGTVVLRFSVDETGRVREIEVESAPDQEGFQKAAIRAIRRGKWKPGKRNGRPVAAWVRRTIDFQP